MGQASGKNSNNTSANVSSGDDALGSSVLNFVVSRGQFSASSTSPGASMSPADFGAWQDELVRQTRSMQKVANISYDEFLANIKHLNEISSHYLDENGKQLVFAVKKGSDSTILWKATVRIACVKIDASSKEIDSYRTLSLKEFLLVFHRLKHQAEAVGFGSGSGSGSGSYKDDSDCKKNSLAEPIAPGAQGASCNPAFAPLFGEIDQNNTSSDECCICLERKPELILPCAHLYCLPCIEQWNVDHKTCPVCRETLDSTDDGWVVSDTPDSAEITTEIQKSLLSLTK